ncbi:oligosaccharide flippase family protein [Moheibacter stercoris]|uniref:O-antigen/teichoic acid export membrane protein n=1 Tax=Moheibacter stercoris TaxID=1628251 RepID=A0ABV2LSW9_9FLAO
MNNSQSSYRQILKATSIFGGVQVFNIVIQLIRSKVVAVLLGPAGMGIMSLFLSSISLVTSATNFGLGTSAVRDIAEANSKDDRDKISETLGVFRKLVWLTGFLGVIVTLIFSPILSKVAFGDYSYTWAFCALSITLLISQLASGYMVIMQGLRKLSLLAKASVVASTIGLIASIFLFYNLGVKGIVPSIIITSISSWAIQRYFSKKIKISRLKIGWNIALKKGRPMLFLGLMLSLSSFFTIAFSYLFRIFISHFGDISEVGLFNAGFTIVNTYVGLVFAAMATDYFPRLSSMKLNKSEQSNLINQQADIAIYLLAPLVIAFLIFSSLIITLLYTSQFLSIGTMVKYAMLGILFKSVSWAIGYQILSQGDSRSFFWNELIASIYLFGLNCLGYYFNGLEGVGVSFLIGYAIHLIHISMFCSYKYGFKFQPKFYKTFILYLILCFTAFLISISLHDVFLYTFGIIMFILTASYSLYNLNKKLGLRDLFNKKFK